jgi:hypothetical protein
MLGGEMATLYEGMMDNAAWPDQRDYSSEIDRSMHILAFTASPGREFRQKP